jgi:uncharacterized membrane protein HdeD (DUF308 family)
MSPQYEKTHLLRRALMGNAVFSTLSGLTVLFAPGWLLRILGLSPDVSLVILGIGLIVFAASLVISARRQHLKRSDTWIAVLMDLAWVLGELLADIRRAIQRRRKMGSRDGCRTGVVVCGSAVCRYS